MCDEQINAEYQWWNHIKNGMKEDNLNEISITFRKDDVNKLVVRYEELINLLKDTDQDSIEYHCCRGCRLPQNKNEMLDYDGHLYCWQCYDVMCEGSIFDRS